MARPTVYTKEVADEICQRIAAGESLRTICADEHLPAKSTFLMWLGQAEPPEGLLDQYARARDIQIDGFVDEIPDIADDGSNDWMAQRDKEGQLTGWRENGESIKRSSLRVDTRFKLAAIHAPKKYGLTTKHTGADGEGPIAITLTPVEQSVA